MILIFYKEKFYTIAQISTEIIMKFLSIYYLDKKIMQKICLYFHTKINFFFKK